MNAEIIRILENEFPEPEGIEGRVSYILSLAEILKVGADQAALNRLSSELLDTVRAISDGTVQGVDEATRERISKRLEGWEEGFAEDEYEGETDGLDPVEVEALSTGRSSAKYPLDREWRRYARSFEGRDLTEEEEDAYRRGVDAGFRIADQLRRGENLDDLDDKDAEP